MNQFENNKFMAGFLGNDSQFDSYLAKHTVPPYDSGKGILYFQHQDRVEPIYDINQPIEFENCTGIHSKPINQLVQQVYEFQNYILEKEKYSAENRELELNHSKATKLLLKMNNKIIAHYSSVKSK